MEPIFLKNLFTSDLHGHKKKYELLFKIISKEKPDGVFIGGDILPNTYASTDSADEFLERQLFQPIWKAREQTRKDIQFFVILGNDDPRIHEEILINADKENTIKYVHNRTVPFDQYFVTGYSFIPPSPFQLKDWEKYDVSRYIDLNSIPPEEGVRSIPVDKEVIQFSTIKEDLSTLVSNASPKQTIYLFHSPPYNTVLDTADLDGVMVEHAPVDVHIGSVAIQRFIEHYQPLLTLHGHVHESTRITKKWRELIGTTTAFTGAHEQHEFCYVSFDPERLANATRTQIIL